jgi:glycine oxidase
MRSPRSTGSGAGLRVGIAGAGLRVGIAGAGLLGRLLAWQLAREGHAVSVFDPSPDGEPWGPTAQAAGFSAAGMLSPTAEAEHAPPAVAALGWRSIARWPAIVAALPGAPAFQARGSLLLAHRADRGTAERVLARLASSAADARDAAASIQPLDARQLAALEPALHGAAHAWLLPGEAQIDPVATMQALRLGATGVQWHGGCRVERVAPGRLALAGGSSLRFDLAIDVRGVGASPGGVALPTSRDEDVGFTPLVHGEDVGFTPLVRGVRGETVWLHAPRHGLTRPVRLLHPRHRVYLVPRSADVLVVGASEIESEDRSPVSLRSAVELMAAAHSVMPGLAEARILRLDSNLRPALPDHLPRTELREGLLRINGLFRHGWLLAPALVDDALAALGLRAPATHPPAGSADLSAWALANAAKPGPVGPGPTPLAAVRGPSMR